MLVKSRSEKKYVGRLSGIPDQELAEAILEVSNLNPVRFAEENFQLSYESNFFFSIT
jgi:hypothetical protein